MIADYLISALLILCVLFYVLRSPQKTLHPRNSSSMIHDSPNEWEQLLDNTIVNQTTLRTAFRAANELMTTDGNCDTVNHMASLYHEAFKKALQSAITFEDHQALLKVQERFQFKSPNEFIIGREFWTEHIRAAILISSEFTTLFNNLDSSNLHTTTSTIPSNAMVPVTNYAEYMDNVVSVFGSVDLEEVLSGEWRPIQSEVIILDQYTRDQIVKHVGDCLRPILIYLETDVLNKKLLNASDAKKIRRFTDVIANQPDLMTDIMIDFVQDGFLSWLQSTNIMRHNLPEYLLTKHVSILLQTVHAQELALLIKEAMSESEIKCEIHVLR